MVSYSYNPKLNKTVERFEFRRTRQLENETIEQHATYHVTSYHITVSCDLTYKPASSNLHSDY